MLFLAGMVFEACAGCGARSQRSPGENGKWENWSTSGLPFPHTDTLPCCSLANEGFVYGSKKLPAPPGLQFPSHITAQGLGRWQPLRLLHPCTPTSQPQHSLRGALRSRPATKGSPLPHPGPPSQPGPHCHHPQPRWPPPCSHSRSHHRNGSLSIPAQPGTLE